MLVRTHDSILLRVVVISVFVLMRSPLDYHARVCDLVSQIILSYSTSLPLQHSPHSKNALRILLKLPLRLTLASLSLSLLCASHIAQLSPARFSRGLTQAHPFSFSPALHPILYLISAVHLRQGPTLRHCVVRCPPIYSGASGERSRGPVYVVTSQGLSESCSPHHRCNRRVSFRG